jgi:hypothetical protein
MRDILVTPETDAGKPKKSLASGDGILCLGLPRTGTLSLRNALAILDIQPVFHGSNYRFEPEAFSLWGRAAWASFPHLRALRGNKLPSYLSSLPPPNIPFTQEDWDDFLGTKYRALTDTGSFFAEELIKAYPTAKVILVERELESWNRSFDVFITQATDTYGPLMRGILEPLTGFTIHRGLYDIFTGWLREDNIPGMRSKTRDRYKEHYAMVRRLVPKDQLLEYKLSQGWEPLCEFLNVPVPDQPFPRTNDAASFKALFILFRVVLVVLALWNILKYLLLVGGAVMLYRHWR